ncbi:Aspyridones efflux protein apdF [Lasiodiplodia hormozganensis]|uniref:Aspyridones efflux protein apdF n=1 Tax=Lasiodiplodia hormozganensis TaxID=869390 RepID=A0AA39Y8E6_9PEZI|nr:Aspyridones efflux protein apdF [Lasiodiplodia hormozganensis]
MEEKSSLEASGQVTPVEKPEQAQAQPAPANEPPNGGVTAWLQVLGSFILFLNTWGIVNSFGVFQTYYASDMLSDETESNISWVGSIQAFLLLIIGVGTGPLFDMGYFQTLLRTGAFLVTFGMFMTSLCTKYWQVMLAQGITIGLGSGCLFIPSVAIVSTYFTTKKSFATGIAASGSSLGGVIYPIIFTRLQPQIGFAWATRVMAFIMLGTMAVAVAVMRVRVLPPQKRRLVDLPALKEVPFLMFSIAEFLGFMGMYIPFFYVQSFAIENNIMSSDLAFYMLSILNAASAFGRIIPNFIADKTGPLNILVPCCAVSALLAFCWIAIDSTAGVIVFAVLYGFFSGTFVSLPPTTVVSLSPNLGVVGTRMGMSFSFAGFGILVGNPVAGAILKDHGWLGVQVFCGVMVIAAAACCVVARFAKAPALMSKA